MKFMKPLTIIKSYKTNGITNCVYLLVDSDSDHKRRKAVKVGGWIYENGSHYIGEWNQLGYKEGIGYLRFPDGSRYGGQFQDGLSDGIGCLWFADGSK